MKPKNPAAALAAMRRKHRRKCPVCGKTFTGIATRKTCSQACRSALFRQNRDGAE